jgi:hypothetical protein
MTARRLISVLAVGLVATATVAAAPRAPAKQAPAKAGKQGPLAPAKDAGPAAGSATPAAGSAAPRGSGDGSPVPLPMPVNEAPPPRDITGTDENPDAPRPIIDVDAPPPTVTPPPKRATTDYPTEEVLRPITLAQNLSEVSIGPHAVVSPAAAADALRARYGITSKIQLGLTYMLGGVFDDPSTVEAKQAFHPGKAVGLDVTVLLEDWIGVRIGVPVYISPLAVSLALGAPIKFTFGDRFALGGFDDLLNIRLHRFAPTFYQEVQNATSASNTLTNTVKSQGQLRVSIFGMYQYEPDLVFIARTGIQMEDFSSGKTGGCAGECQTTFLHAGLRYTPRTYLDVGLSIGFDDLARGGTFAPAGFLAFRI